ncbi:YhdP family protein [Limnohabitans sp.]|uniref:YhdP family protein n=1 Tax=Limnohabitans sp. TaxID=1907725 RepID=UPI0039BCE16E|nr:TIGR02099 family protein [Comamonadaceae bacterium]
MSPVEPRLQRWLTRGVRLFLWGLLLAGLVLGMAWAGLHFWIVPRIDEYRPAMERLARQSLGIPVQIGAVTAQSTGWVPSFELRDIELLDPENRPALLLPKVTVALSLRSALLWQLDQLVLDAPELDVRRTPDGLWQVGGMTWGPTLQADSAAADWLFSQREVIVRAGVLRWHVADVADAPATSSPPVVLKDMDVVIRNSSRTHSLRVDATPPNAWGERFVLMGQFKRKVLSTRAGRFADWSGQTYAFVPQLDLTPMRAAVPAEWTNDWGQLQGQGTLRLWADVDKGQWQGAMADVSLVGLQAQLRAESLPLAFERLSGRFGIQMQKEGFLANTQGLSFVNKEGVIWPGGNVSLEYTQAQGSRPARGVLQADQLDLHALREMALRLPQASAIHPAFQARDLSGLVSHLHLRWQGQWQHPETYEAKVSIQGLHWQPDAQGLATTPTSAWAQLPGMRGADVNLDMRHDGGQMDVRMGQGSAVWLPGMLSPAEVPLHQLQASARWARLSRPGGGTWQVPAWTLKMANADLQGEWRGQWQSTPHGPGALTLDGKIDKLNVATVHRYLPVGLPASVLDYLRDALVNGTYSDVNVKIKGDLAKLPFKNPKDGELRFSGRLKDVVLNMVPPALLPPGGAPWPRLSGLQGRLQFDRAGMRLSEASAQAGEAGHAVLLTAPLVEIADMTQQALLQVRAESTSGAPQVLRLIQQSALNALLSEALAQAQVRGNLQTRFELRLPLLNLKETQVKGNVVFKGVDLRMQPETPWLENMQGQLQFQETSFDLRPLQAQLWGGPVSLEGSMRRSNNNPAAPARIEFQARGRVSAEGLRTAKEFYPLDWLAQHAQGSANYTAQLAWRDGKPDLSVNSNLEGMAVQLPAPLGKSTASTRPLNIVLRSQQEKSGPHDHIQVTLADNVRVAYLRNLTGKVPQVVRGIWGVGIPAQQMPAWPDSGVSAQVVLDQLDVDEWLALMPDPSGTASAPNMGAPIWQSYLPNRMGLKTNTLTVNGRSLHKVTAGGTRDGAQWRANIEAQEMSGHIGFLQSYTGQAGQLFARLSRLNLPPAEIAEVEALLEAPPTKLPALDIVIDALQLRGIPLGRIEIEAINQESGPNRLSVGSEWQLKKFNVLLPEAQLKSTGRWLAIKDANARRKTEMNFVLDIQDAGALLNRLGTPNALRGGVGQLAGTVNWQGSPLALDYPSMNGQFEVRMGRGQFLKADAGAAKLLGVLSLQALPRRLLLDFRDVFDEGFAFDAVRGDVGITQGTAHTSNLQIKGVNALILLDGEANIAQETQKLRAHILPIVDTGTTSLLAGLALNPAVGLTVFVAQWLLKNPLSRASSQEFTIDGSWDSPRVTRIDKRP